MSKKVSELIKELDVNFEKLNGYAEQLGIKISGEKASIDDILVYIAKEDKNAGNH